MRAGPTFAIVRTSNPVYTEESPLIRICDFYIYIKLLFTKFAARFETKYYKKYINCISAVLLFLDGLGPLTCSHQKESESMNLTESCRTPCTGISSIHASSGLCLGGSLFLQHGRSISALYCFYVNRANSDSNI